MRAIALSAALLIGIAADPGLAQTSGDPALQAEMPPAVTVEEPDSTGAIDRSPMDDPRTETPTVSVDQWIGTRVVSADGVDVGKVSDVETDAAGRPVSITAEIGGFFGFGADTVQLPVAETDFDGDELRIGMVETDIRALASGDENSAVGITSE